MHPHNGSHIYIYILSFRGSLREGIKKIWDTRSRKPEPRILSLEHTYGRFPKHQGGLFGRTHYNIRLEEATMLSTYALKLPQESSTHHQIPILRRSAKSLDLSPEPANPQLNTFSLAANPQNPKRQTLSSSEWCSFWWTNQDQKEAKMIFCIGGTQPNHLLP